MNRAKVALVLLLLVGATAGIFYREYTIRRMPTPSAETSGAFDPTYLVSAGTVDDGILAIDDPRYESVGAADAYLRNEGEVIVVSVGERTRIYPHQLLVWHQAVNDTLNGVPILVAYSPLTASSAVFERGIGNGAELMFGVSGQLYDNGLVLFDRGTHSLWIPAFGRAVQGDMIDTQLVPLVSHVTTWDAAKREFPRAEVLAREPEIVSDYTVNPYASYAESRQILFPLSHTDDRLAAKELVYGLSIAGVTRAYRADSLKQNGELEETVGTLRIRLFWDEDLDAARAFDLSADEEIPCSSTYWFSWVAVHPETELWNP